MFELIQLITSNIWIYGGSFLIVLSLLVFVHEWGHYIVARMCGVRVETFSIGFGPEIGGFTDKHDTRWKFSLIPLGGYVQMFGDQDPASAKKEAAVEDKETGKKRKMKKAELKVAFFNKPVWKRAAIVFAGPAINYIFAIILLAGLFAFNGKVATPPVGAAVIAGSSAEEAGFQPHDIVRSIDDVEMNGFEDIRRAMLISLDQKRHFKVERNGTMIDLYATPERKEDEDRFGFKSSRGFLGLISPRQAIDIKYITKIGETSYSEGQSDKVLADLQRRMGTRFVLETTRGESVDRLIVQPLTSFNEHIATPDHENQNILMLADINENVVVEYAPAEAALEAVKESWSITVNTLEALGQMVTGHRSATELGGIIRIGAIAGDMAQKGLVSIIFFTALLSINLGFINLMPIPMLDGGHLLFYGIEAVSGRPIPERIQEYAFRAGFAVLIALMAFTNINDIVQILL